MELVSAEQDALINQLASRSFKHGRCAPGQDLGACEGMIANFINTNLQLAKTFGSDGLNDKALKYFAMAAHTLADLGSPSHADSDGTPTVWGLAPNQWGHDIAHVRGESDEGLDWWGIGQSYRNVAAGWKASFPEEKQPDPQKAIQQDVDNYFNSRGAKASHLDEGAARQCALGNLAACGR